MNKSGFFTIIIIAGLWGLALADSPVTIKNLPVEIRRGLIVKEIIDSNDNPIEFTTSEPFFSVELNDRLISSQKAKVRKMENDLSFTMPFGIIGTVVVDRQFSPGWKAVITFTNASADTIKLANVIPFGQSSEHIYLTSTGPSDLARAKIFRPGLGPVGVILPDNAWEMGYSAVKTKSGVSICAITRRTAVMGGEKRRYHTLLPPGACVEYTFYADTYSGEWQNGLRLMFQDRFLYDVVKFDNTLYERNDLKWIRHSYLATLLFSWDHYYYEMKDNSYGYEEFLKNSQRLLGGYDIFAIWPTWPRLGVDSRNQWDIFDDMPGGCSQVKRFVENSHDYGTRFFIMYNPWDLSTREEDPYEGMARLLKDTDADGVVLDCHGSSSKQLQAAADGVKPGIIMYSEGMAVPKDMQGIVAGRVHDAIFMPPPLNLNKLIKPDIAIFRVCQLNDGMLHREIGVSFFNGIGTELNTYRPGRPDWIEEAFRYLGKTTKILRENTSVFTGMDWTPLLPTLQDSIWVNQFPGEGKTLYTVFSLIPEGFSGPLFPVKVDDNSHFVDIWHHEEIAQQSINGKTYLPVKVQAFERACLNTRQEGNIDCIARFSELLKVRLEGDSLKIICSQGDRLLIWAGAPTYDGKFVELKPGTQTVSLRECFGRYEGKFVVQLFESDELSDERIVTIEPGTARLISKLVRTEKATIAPDGMVLIPGGQVGSKLESNDSFIFYPDCSYTDSIEVQPFYMDVYPVTNLEFKKFVDATHYKPADDHNFLRHWENGEITREQEMQPVVWISREDACAYADWIGKRLPGEYEWQLAASGPDGRIWPWGNEFDSTRCNVGLGELTPVDQYPGGASPYGVRDLVGNVWQLTNDLYDDSSYYFAMMRGGSYYNPTASWWYIQGGPQELKKHQLLLLMASGFDRCATVGFRCVKDVR